MPPEDDIWIACASARGVVDEDHEPVARALGGVRYHEMPWDADIDWSKYDLVVIRSTWDYTYRVDEFLAWVHSLGSVANPADVIEWNHDKRYLRALQVAGVPVVRTLWDPTTLPPGRWVAKPTISAGARDTIAGDADDALRQVELLHALGRRAMVQPYLDGIDERGETALVYFDGALSHCVAKHARLGLEKVDESISPRVPTADELELAEQVMDTLPFDRSSLLYARVDLVPDRNGDPVVLEVELIEPSLFLTSDPTGAAVDRFAAAILGRF